MSLILMMFSQIYLSFSDHKNTLLKFTCFCTAKKLVIFRETEFLNIWNSHSTSKVAFMHQPSASGPQGSVLLAFFLSCFLSCFSFCLTNFSLSFLYFLFPLCTSVHVYLWKPALPFTKPFYCDRSSSSAGSMQAS